MFAVKTWLRSVAGEWWERRAALAAFPLLGIVVLWVALAVWSGGRAWQARTPAALESAIALDCERANCLEIAALFAHHGLRLCWDESKAADSPGPAYLARPTLTLRSSRVTLREVLEEFCRQNPGYRWHPSGPPDALVLYPLESDLLVVVPGFTAENCDEGSLARHLGLPNIVYLSRAATKIVPPRTSVNVTWRTTRLTILMGAISQSNTLVWYLSHDRELCLERVTDVQSFAAERHKMVAVEGTWYMGFAKRPIHRSQRSATEK